MDVLGSIITAGVAVLAIALIAVITANTMERSQKSLTRSGTIP